MVLGLILLIYPIDIWDRMLIRVRFYQTFLSSPTDTRFKQLLFGGSYTKNPKNLQTNVIGRLFSEMQISRLCH